MKINDVMSVNVRIANSDDTVRGAARSMVAIDAGALPVGEGDQLVGMITDRDIVLRAVSEGLDLDVTKVREVMSPKLHYCFATDEVEEVARTMAELQVRRLPVLNEHRKLVGMVSIGDLSQNIDSGSAGATLESISGP